MAEAAPTLGDLVVMHGRRRRLAPDEVLFSEGDASDSVYVCVDGRLRVFVTTPVGRTLLLGIKVPGQVVGELSALDGRPRSAAVSAIERAVVAALPADAFLRVLGSAPRLAVSLLADLSGHLRSSNARVTSRDADSTAVRAGRVLAELAEKFVRHANPRDQHPVAPVGPVGPVVVPITQDELAAWIGASREATARALATLRQRGVISTGRHRIVVHDRHALATVPATSGREHRTRRGGTTA